MERLLLLIALGWLVFGSVVHFVIDVVSQRLRGVRTPSPATTAYYGLHSAYPLSQLLLAALGLLIAAEAPALLCSFWFKAICLMATLLWLCICVLFIEYKPPRIIAGIFGAIIVAATLTGA